ncbi:MAG: trypsin-like peptidase domain-containing protein [Candidatus Omnitrophota bacterium]
MLRNILIFFFGFNFLMLAGQQALAQDNGKNEVYNYEQKTIGRTVKKDLEIPIAIFVSDGNLKYKDSLFNLPQDEQQQVTAVTVDKAEIKIDNAKNQDLKKRDSDLLSGFLTNALLKSGKFNIVERQDINALLREAEFSNSKWVNPQQANRIGNVYGVKHIVIANLLRNESGNRVTAGNYALTLRLCEVETGNISASGQGEGLNIKEAVINAVSDFSAKVSSQPWSTRIIKIEDGFIYFAAGTNEGLKVKDVLELYKLKSQIVDPQTNKVLGAEKIKVGNIEVVEILRANLSKAKVLESIEPVAADFIIQASPVENKGTDEMLKWKKIYGDTNQAKPIAEGVANSVSEAAPAANMSMSIEGLVQAANPAVVMITTVTSNGTALGSGFLISSDGVIVTNNHVIKGAEGLGVKFAQGKELITNVSVVKTDALRDIAIIKVNTPVNVTPLSLGDSEQIAVGERVVAIGNPQGLQNTVSDGLVSAVRDDGGIKQIQISVPISHGSSGGALINMRGEVIGITSSGIEQGQNLNFAIPINYVKEYLQK